MLIDGEKLNKWILKYRLNANKKIERLYRLVREASNELDKLEFMREIKREQAPLEGLEMMQDVINNWK